MHRLIRLSVTAAAAGLAALTAIAPASASNVSAMHSAKTRGGNGATASSPLAWNGGPVETTPKVYIDFWGSTWSNYSSAQTYNINFFGNVGGSNWAGIDTQYCENAVINTGTCVTNPKGQLKGSYVHNVTLPRRITQSAIAAEAVWAMNNVFGGYDPNATYFVYTPHGHSMSGFATSWCAWHSSTSSNGNTVAYAYMPYQPDAGYNCGANSVDGTFDGFSIVGGHEYAEAVTDPHPSSGWTDTSGSEIGDKCAWVNLSNQNFNGMTFPVQPLYSDAAGGCAVS
ncbi:MAG TPA: hypothetical protein VF137_03895 [Candidatus Dormibacteraeota bacterium]